MACEEGNFRIIVMTATLTEMAHSRSIAIQSERARRRSPRAALTRPPANSPNMGADRPAMSGAVGPNNPVA
jgi:hypothetical protein